MKTITAIFVLAVVSTMASRETVYQGCTPPHRSVRDFLGISQTDSIDFIRWRLVVRPTTFELSCQYGIGKPNTNGFIDEKRVSFSGSAKKIGHKLHLARANKSFVMAEVNPDLLQLLDENQNLLRGNGGFSYTLNIYPTPSSASDQFNLRLKPSAPGKQMTYEGRTPCREISGIIGLPSGSECRKLKWLITLNADPTTGKPSGFSMTGTGYRKEGLVKGTWEIIQGSNGKIIYKLTTEKYNPIFLLKGDDNVLFFTDPDGRLLVGNEDFSYTLNRRMSPL